MRVRHVDRVTDCTLAGLWKTLYTERAYTVQRHKISRCLTSESQMLGAVPVVSGSLGWIMEQSSSLYLCPSVPLHPDYRVVAFRSPARSCVVESYRSGLLCTALWGPW